MDGTVVTPDQLLVGMLSALVLAGLKAFAPKVRDQVPNFLWPLAVFEVQRPLATVARDAARAFLRRPIGFLGLAVALAIVNAVGVAAAILPFLTLTIAYSFLVSAHFALPKNPAREA